jgi:hypothetical protein
MQCQGPLHLDTILQHRRYGSPGLVLSCAEHGQEQGHDSLQDPLRIHASILPYVCRHRMHTHAAYVSSSTKQGFTNEPATTGSSSIALTQPLMQARTAAYCCFQTLDCQRYLLQLLRQQLIGTRAGSLERTAQRSPQCAYCVLEEAQQLTCRCYRFWGCCSAQGRATAAATAAAAIATTTAAAAATTAATAAATAAVEVVYRGNCNYCGLLHKQRRQPHCGPGKWCQQGSTKEARLIPGVLSPH